MFRECSGLDSETEVIEHKSVDENGLPVMRKVAGAHEVVEHHAQARRRREPRHLEVARHGHQGGRRQGARRRQRSSCSTTAGSRSPTYKFKQGWPIKYIGATLNASTQQGGARGDPDLPRGHRAGVGSSEARHDDEDRVRIHAAARATSTPTGRVHRDGTMRLATARDEIEPLRDAEVRQNEAYLTVLLLVTRGHPARRRRPTSRRR